MEGLGGTLWADTNTQDMGLCICLLSLAGSVPYGQALEQPGSPAFGCFFRAAARVRRPPAGGTGGLHELSVRPLTRHSSASEDSDAWHFALSLAGSHL